MREYYQRNIENRLIIPTKLFLQREKSSGIILAVSVILALILANSPFRESYFSVLKYHFGFVFNDQPFFNFSVEHWINDGLMSMFFFVIGLELKREFIDGELRHIRKVTLPVAASVFGMLFPAAFYLLFNFGTPAVDGWVFRPRGNRRVIG